VPATLERQGAGSRGLSVRAAGNGVRLGFEMLRLTARCCGRREAHRPVTHSPRCGGPYLSVHCARKRDRALQWWGQGVRRGRARGVDRSFLEWWLCTGGARRGDRNALHSRGCNDFVSGHGRQGFVRRDTEAS